MIVHTRPRKQPQTSSITASWGLLTVTGHYPCGNCNVCHLTRSSKAIPVGNSKIWTQKRHTNCKTRNCIYLITCPCSLQYVGMTTRPVNIRINEHRSTIRCKKTSTKLTCHYLDKQHQPNDLEWTVLETVSEDDKTAKSLFRKEQQWIFRLLTSVTGLNDDIPWTQL